jgi:hypothetical protein
VISGFLIEDSSVEIDKFPGILVLITDESEAKGIVTEAAMAVLAEAAEDTENIIVDLEITEPLVLIVSAV